MAQDLTVNVKTTSDVPQAMDRAKSATVSFSKQLDDIQKKFSMAFKDVFLSFLGPMALLGIAMNYIGKLIDDNRKKHEAANQAAIDGTNELMSAEDKYWARKRDRDNKSAKDKEQAAMSREDITKDFLLNDALGRSYLRKKMYGDSRKSNRPSFLKPFESADEREAAGLLASGNEAQMFVQFALKEKMRENPELGKATDFKTPEGFSNVVGVGSNPVMEAMNAQLEEAQKQTVLLEKIASPEGGVPKDFTKNSK